jgi:hypothetical protein
MTPITLWFRQCHAAEPIGLPNKESVQKEFPGSRLRKKLDGPGSMRSRLGRSDVFNWKYKSHYFD